LVATFLFSKTSTLFEVETWFMETYRDNGLQAWKQIMSNELISQWLFRFQSEVNKILELDKLVFSIEVWNY